jgi:hypothetical protein
MEGDGLNRDGKRAVLARIPDEGFRMAYEISLHTPRGQGLYDVNEVGIEEDEHDINGQARPKYERSERGFQRRGHHFKGIGY